MLRGWPLLCVEIYREACSIHAFGTRPALLSCLSSMSGSVCTFLRIRNEFTTWNLSVYGRWTIRSADTEWHPARQRRNVICYANERSAYICILRRMTINHFELPGRFRCAIGPWQFTWLLFDFSSRTVHCLVSKNEEEDVDSLWEKRRTYLRWERLNDTRFVNFFR